MKKFSILSILALVTLASCGTTTSNDNSSSIGGGNSTPTVPSMTVAEKLAAAAGELLKGVDITKVTANLPLITSGLHGVEITWESENFNIINSAGVVVRPGSDESDITLELQATLTLGSEELIKVFIVTVLKKVNSSYSTIKDLYERGVEASPVTMKGVVTSFGSKAAFITDGTDSLAIYFNSVSFATVEYGDEIVVTGTFSRHNSLAQIQDIQNFEILSKANFVIPSFVNAVPSDLVSLDHTTDKAISGRQYRIVGTVMEEQNGAYKDLVIKGSDGERVMVYYQTSEASKIALKAFLGKIVSLECNYYVVDGTNGTQILFDKNVHEVVETGVVFSGILEAKKKGPGTYNIKGTVVEKYVDPNKYYGDENVVVLQDAAGGAAKLVKVTDVMYAAYTLGKEVIVSNTTVTAGKEAEISELEIKYAPLSFAVTAQSEIVATLGDSSITAAPLTMSVKDFMNNVAVLKDVEVIFTDLKVKGKSLAYPNQYLILGQDKSSIYLSFKEADSFGMQDAYQVGDNYRGSLSFSGTFTITDPIVTTKKTYYLKAFAQNALTTEAQKLIVAKTWVSLPKQTAHSSIVLPTTGKFGSTITWTSADQSIIKDDGTILPQGETKSCIMKATIKIGTAELIKELSVEVLPVSVLTASDLFISEVNVEKSTNKILEIANFTNSEILLADYKLSYYSQTQDFTFATPATTLLGNLAPSIKPGEVMIVGGSSIDGEVMKLGAYLDSAINFTGVWKIRLFKGETAIDNVGTNGKAVENGCLGVKLTGKITRNVGVTSPNAEFTITEWTRKMYNIDESEYGDYAEIGHHKIA